MSSKEHRAAAGRQIVKEMLQVMRRGLHPDDIGELLPIWQEGVLMQLNSTPADIHIERWINKELPGLREAQNAALRNTLEEYQQVLKPVVRRFTPSTIFRASVAMNYAFAKAIAEMFGEPKLLRPYRGAALEAALGERLYAIVQSVGDGGHVGDRLTSERWARDLRLSGWYLWVKMENVQGSAYSQGRGFDYGTQT